MLKIPPVDSIRGSARRSWRRCIALIAGMAWLSAAIGASAPAPNASIAAPAAASTVDAPAILRAMRRIVTPDGIESMQKVRLGGIEQWISVRGRHRDNPILLFLHGGPSFTTMPASYSYATPWEEYFTVVQWDQRGAGKTYRENDPKQVAPTMSRERIVGDAEELVSWLRKTYGKQKIVLVGHSWGSVLGVELAQRHPDWFYAYVGVGQVVDMQRSEAASYQTVLAMARKDGNTKAVNELQGIAPYPDLSLTPAQSVAKLGVDRRWIVYYGGYFHGEKQGHDAQLIKLSPDYSDADKAARDAGSDFSVPLLWNALMKASFMDTTRFGCPIVLFLGRHDLTVNAPLTAQWFASLQAPSKQLVWFEDSGHIIFEEESGKFLVQLVNTVLPLTRPAANQAAR